MTRRLHHERYASEYTGLSLSTLRRMRRRRASGDSGPDAGPRFVHIMSAVRYAQDDLDEWIDALRKTSVAARLTCEGVTSQPVRPDSL